MNRYQLEITPERAAAAHRLAESGYFRKNHGRVEAPSLLPSPIPHKDSVLSEAADLGVEGTSVAERILFRYSVVAPAGEGPSEKGTKGALPASSTNWLFAALEDSLQSFWRVEVLVRQQLLLNLKAGVVFLQLQPLESKGRKIISDSEGTSRDLLLRAFDRSTFILAPIQMGGDLFSRALDPPLPRFRDTQVVEEVRVVNSNRVSVLTEVEHSDDDWQFVPDHA
jgi:hypothetical protein